MSKLGGLLLVGFVLLAIYGCEKQQERSRENEKTSALQEQFREFDRCNRNGVPVSRCHEVAPEVKLKWIEQDMREMDRKLGIK